MNEELRELYEADQADRRTETPPADAIGRDRARRQRVARMLDVGEARTGEVWELYQVDSATTDAERAEWDVPSLEEARRRAVEMTERRPPPGGLQPLVTHRVGDLEVQVRRMTHGAPTQQPPPEPLQPGDPVPWLPPGLSAMRLGASFGATDGSGEVAVAWYRVGMQVVVGWREEDGPAPEPETIEVAGHTAILCHGIDGCALVTVSRPGNLSWMVASKGPREELLRIAASLP